MNPSKHLTLWGAECTYTETQDGLLVSPINSEDHLKLLAGQMVNKEPFYLPYGSPLQHCAYIEHINLERNAGIRLIASHIFKDIHYDSFDQMTITGEVIDDFFSPSRYFIEYKEKNKDLPPDLLYNHIVADEWRIDFKNQPLLIQLQYGDILTAGTVSDFVLHPKLVLFFEPTNDIVFVFQIYAFVLQFFQFVRYSQYVGNFQVSLATTIDANRCKNGLLLIPESKQFEYNKGPYDLDHMNGRAYIQPLLQFFASQPVLYCKHFPERSGIAFNRTYTPLDFQNIYSAFEAECHANRAIYEKTDDTPIQPIREKLLSLIKEIPTQGMNTEERKFLNDAKSRLLDLGAHYGQKNKITNAFFILESCLSSSIKRILHLPNHEQASPLATEEISKFAKCIVSKRSALVHGNTTTSFSSSDIQYIRLLEIMVYCQILRRAKLSDDAIERIIGVVFLCNTILFHEMYPGLAND